MQGPFARARLRALLDARERRRNVSARRYVAASGFTDPQLRAHYGPVSRYRALFWSRRTGKTDYFARRMLETATTTPRCNVVYASTTHLRAVKTIWDPILAEVARFEAETGIDLECSPHTQTSELRFGNGSKIHILGFETKKHVDRIRGIPKIAEVNLDEMQDHDPEFLVYAIGSVIQPALADLMGTLTCAGTGGPPNGFWHEIVTNPALGFEVFRASIWENPHIPDPDGEVEAACRLRGVTRNDPYIRREFGSRENGIEFTTDSERSVFPRITMRSVELPAGYRAAVGGDVGSVDKTAACVTLLHRAYNGMVMRASGEKQTPGSSDQLRYLSEWRDGWEQLTKIPVYMAVDPGGGGKGVMEDMRKTLLIGDILPAEKFDKAYNFRMFADDVRTGFCTIEPGNEALVKALEGLEWEAGYEGVKLKGHTPDIADAALYAWRLARKLFFFDSKLVEADTQTPEDAALERQWNAEEQFLRENGWQ